MNLDTVACRAQGGNPSLAGRPALADGALAVISALVRGIFSPKTPRDLLLATRNTAPRRSAVATPTLTFYQAAVATVRDKKLARDDKKWLG